MGLLSTLGGIAGNFLLPGIGGVIGAGLGGAIEGRKSVGEASQTQQQAAQGGIDEQRRQFDAIQKLLQPYTEAGPGALAAQQAFLGLQGPEAEQAAIDRITGGSTFQELSRQGEEAILSRASATGGLRGGNVQAALAQFRPQLLNQLIEQQYGRLGGFTELGQRSAVGQGAQGVALGANVSNLLGRQGQAQAGGILGQQGALSGGLGQAFGAIDRAGGLKKLFGSSSPSFQGGGAVNPISGEFMGSLEF